jgi:hypothetical protein
VGAPAGPAKERDERGMDVREKSGAKRELMSFLSLKGWFMSRDLKGSIRKEISDIRFLFNPLYLRGLDEF